MASKQHDDEFELILGNKQLLSLFFVIVAFFAAFFSVGYVVGYGHGEQTTVAAAEDEPLGLPERALTAALAREEPPAPRPPTHVAQPTQSSPPAEAKPKPAKPAPAPAAKPKPTQTAAARTAPPKPKSKPVAPKPAPAKPAPKPAVSGSAYHVQVAALRVSKDAQALAGRLKAKGYPAAVSDKGDGYVRVVVGPFASEAAAKTYRTKLAKDGFDTMLRKL